VPERISAPPSLASLYPRALLGSLPLPLIRRRGDELPDREIELPEARADADRLAEYARVCGFRLRDELPATYPHLLAFPMAMRLMTDRSFPFGVLGLVHTRNRITQLRPIRLGEPISLRVWTDGLEPHDRGRQFDVLAAASVGDEPVWRSASTYLHQEGRAGSGGARPSPDAPPEPPAIWTIPGDVGRRYAAVSGDRNPIHLHPLTAKLFGLRRPIAHGMWLKARCLAALEGKVPEAFTIDVRFRSAVPLPATVGFASWRENGGRGLALRQPTGDKVHLTGTVAATV
jgi:acyl dehydratase